MAIPDFINSIWAIIIIVAAIAILLTSYAGWIKFKGEIFWRSIKLSASIIGMTGIAIALLNFDIATRALWKDPAQEYMLLDFINARTELSMSMAEICSESTTKLTDKNSCWDLKNIASQINSINIRDRIPLKIIENWQRNPRIDEAIRQANSRIDFINRNMAIPVNDRQLVSPLARMYVLLASAFLLALAAAGTIGEAVYQLRVSMERGDKKR